jgi:hypothetical protein
MSVEIDPKEVERIQRETIRAVLDLFSVESADFYYNQPNDYGTITLKLWTDDGNPLEKYRGEEIKAQFRDGYRGSGMYKLNDATVDLVFNQVKRKHEE